MEDENASRLTASLEENPFRLIDEGQLMTTLKVLKIKRSVWDAITTTYPNAHLIYDPSIVDDYPGEDFATITNQFFDFKSANTISARKTIFKKWLKEYWNIFKARTFEQCCENIYATLKAYNSESEYPLPCINWIPSFGGMLSIVVKEYSEFRFKQINKIEPPLVHCALEKCQPEGDNPEDRVPEQVLNTPPGIKQLQRAERPKTPELHLLEIRRFKTPKSEHEVPGD
jgi:hypothetical protein